jgi:hypothetical protein
MKVRGLKTSGIVIFYFIYFLKYDYRNFQIDPSNITLD